MALAMLTAACVQLNEAVNDEVNGRDVECNEVPDDICVRLADDLSQWFPDRVAEHGPIVKVNVRPADCSRAIASQGQVVARCWEGMGNAAVRADGSEGPSFGRIYYQVTDGRIFGNAGRVLETFPEE